MSLAGASRVYSVIQETHHESAPIVGDADYTEKMCKANEIAKWNLYTKDATGFSGREMSLCNRALFSFTALVVSNEKC